MTPWTCPFCALLCDRFALESTASGALELHGSDCPRATRALAQSGATPARAQPTIEGSTATLDAAIDAAADVLGGARQPLFGGLATDIAGARALYALANSCHAILDHAHSNGLLPGLRTLQDRGLLQTTLAEIRNRADLMVVFGTQPSQEYPEFFRRCGVGDAISPLREIVFVGTAVDPASTGAAVVAARSLPWSGDAYATLAALNALCKRRQIEAAGALRELAQRMLAAKYVVLVWEPGRLPGTHRELLVESINQLGKTVNRTTRAGGLALAGNDGGHSANQTLTWLSGLPLRTGVHPGGLAHEPHRYAGSRLLADRAVDALLWIASFGTDHVPGTGNATSSLPTIVLAHPAHAARAAARVFIPVATPGIGAPGHLFRLDGVVVVPLAKVRDDGLPAVAAVVERIDARLKRVRRQSA
ncbi:MAG TPA: formylmethanofuran dehydrogenase [Burkholderiaceae bacterium]|nr:formylmethanofuran dehydrogenase [Burkholderiaceae bacterium]